MVSNMNNNKFKLKSLTNPVSFEALAIAHRMHVQGQNAWYWKTYPRPFRPEGIARFEKQRQAATFLVPLIGMTVATIAFGFDSLRYSVPAALLVGFLIDLDLKITQKKRLKQDLNLDRGRFEGTIRLVHELGLRPEAITLELVEEMEAAYQAEIAKRELHEKNKQQAVARNHEMIVEATRRLTARQAAGAPPLDYSGRGHATAAAGVAAATAAGVSFADVADSDGVIDPVHIEMDDVPMILVNPASGLPMATSGFDVAGNAFGTGFPD